jgi:hypothetical protein
MAGHRRVALLQPSGRLLLLTLSQTAAVILVIGIGVASVYLWLAGELSALVFSGKLLGVGPLDIIASPVRFVLSFPDSLADPTTAWPAASRGAVPSAAAYYGVLVGLVVASAALAETCLRWRMPSH